MKKEELISILKEQRKVISTRIANIDNLLDRMAYGSLDESEELDKEREELEKKMEAIRKSEEDIAHLKGIEISIANLENELDSLELEVKPSERIGSLKRKIEESENTRSKILYEIEKYINENILKR